MDCESPSPSPRWELLRIQAHHPVTVELLSGDWVRLSTHFHRKTFLCSESSACPCCDLLPVRAYWYLPALLHPMRRACLIEFSAAASSDLEQHAKLLSGKIGPGLVVNLSRRTPKAPVKSEVVSDSCAHTSLRFHQWVSALMAIYHMPPILEGEKVDEYGLRITNMVDGRSAVIAGTIKSLAPKGV